MNAKTLITCNVDQRGSHNHDWIDFVDANDAARNSELSLVRIMAGVSLADG
jgi:hypothetical protein